MKLYQSTGTDDIPDDEIPRISPTPKQSLSIPGAIPGGLSIGPPGKSSIDDSYGRYDLIQNSESPASPPVAVPHSWSRAKTDSDKISNGSSINWPPGNKTPSPRLKLMSLKHIDGFIESSHLPIHRIMTWHTLCYLWNRVSSRSAMERTAEYRSWKWPWCYSWERSHRAYHQHHDTGC